MRSISGTIARLSAREKAVSPRPVVSPRLRPFTDFGSNPGNLKGWIYHAADLPEGAPLVVVLHGCTQTAAGYDRGSGWSTLAERHGFALLYPEQQRANNANLCFNWFQPEDISDSGEALSIRQMVIRLVADLGVDPSRVFVTGLSAGGAMTSVMLATSPDLFAGGAVIAGLPFGSASGMPAAFDRMRGHGGPTATELARRVRTASSHRGRWPALSVWHGTADHTVAVANMDALVEQWRILQNLPADPSETELLDRHVRRVWRDANGDVRIEAIAVDGMGHGTPLDPSGPNGCGQAEPYMLDVGISSTQHIAASWGIANVLPWVGTAKVQRERGGASISASATPSPPVRPATPLPVSGVAKVIDDALRAAGLIR